MYIDDFYKMIGMGVTNIERKKENKKKICKNTKKIPYNITSWPMNE